MKTILLKTDGACWVKDRLEKRMLGGAENFFLLLRKWLLDAGYGVYDPILHVPAPGIDYDLVIYSNVCDDDRQYPINTKKRLLWCGSTHAYGYDRADKTIVISGFMKKEKGFKDALVIPAPYANEVLKYERHPIKGRIVTTSNPNRFISHAFDICKTLDLAYADYEWIVTGGNKLYGPRFNEAFSLEQYRHPLLHYRGPLVRQELIALLGTAHLWVYPNFTDKSETQCVAMLEAAALGIPTIVPNREPFTSVLPEAIFVNNPLDAANKIIENLDVMKIDYDVSRYSENVIMPQYLKVIADLVG